MSALAVQQGILPAETPLIRSHDLVEMLRRHYLPDGRPAGGIFAAEIESPDGRRRADALWAPWSIAGGSRLVGHEIKVSRSDVLIELADPMKAEPWARDCSQWWLVVADPALVAGLTLPDAWGVMAPPSGRKRRSMTVVREAPSLKPADTGAAWRRIATWEHVRLEQRIRESEYAAARSKSDAEWAKRELDEVRASGEGRRDPRSARIGQLISALDAQGSRAWLGLDRTPVEQIVAAIVDVEDHRRLARTARAEIEMLVESARRIAKPMDYVADELAKLTKMRSDVDGLGR
jgi:hypothetical protein